MPLEDNMSHGASRLRAYTTENLEEDLKLLKEGVLDHHSFLSGYQMHNHPVEVLVHDSEGKLKSIRRTHNLRTDFGGRDQGSIMSNPGNTYTVADYIGLTNTIIIPKDGDTVLTGEITTGTLVRTVAGYQLKTPPSGGTATQTAQGTYVLSATWGPVAPASATTIYGCGVFNSQGDLWFEAAINGGVAIGSGDTVTLSYTINY